MHKHTSIKQVHLAKLKVLRDEIAKDVRDNKRRAQALRRAEECEASWEIIKAGAKPLRQGRLFR